METGILVLLLQRGEECNLSCVPPLLRNLEIKCFFEDSHLKID